MTPCSLKIETIISELVEGLLPIIPKISWSNFNQFYCNVEIETFYETEINTFNPYSLKCVMCHACLSSKHGSKVDKLMKNEKGV